VSKDSPRTINDCYVRVYLRRYDASNPSEYGERIDVVVRIPEEVGKILAGPGRKPEVLVGEVWRRAASVAAKTVGVPDFPLAISVIFEVDSIMPPDLPEKSNFKDEDGAEGWIF
jgi:hypothetical protein